MAEGQKRKGEGRESGGLRSRSRHQVGQEVSCCKTTLFVPKMTTQFSLLVFPSVFYTSTLPLLTLKKASLYKDVGAARHMDTGQAAPWDPHCTLNMSDTEREIILSFLSLLDAHMHMNAFIHKHAQGTQANAAHKNKRPPQQSRM